MFFSLLATIQEIVPCAELTGLQVVAGFVTWMNILRVFAIVGGVVCIGFILMNWFSWLVEVFFLIPVELYEFLGFVGAVGLVVGGQWASPTNELWFTLSGSLLLGAILLIVDSVHEIEMKTTSLFGILFLVWSIIAIYYTSDAIGFIAVGAFMGLYGFSALVVPGGYLLGFDDEEDSLSRATTAALFVLTIFVVTKATGTSLGPDQVFEQGALWFGSFVGYLGLLIASTRWYGNYKNYVVMQFVTIFFGMAALAAGSLLDIGPLLGVGGTFFVLYLIEKPFEIPAEDQMTYAYIGLFVATVVGTGVWWAQNHMDLVEPYLLF